MGRVIPNIVGDAATAVLVAKTEAHWPTCRRAPQTLRNVREEYMETGKINALMMEETDNVVTCIMEIKKGDTVVYRKGRYILCRGGAGRTFPTATRSL